MAIKKAIIVGWINKGKTPDCGETVKNQLMIERLQALGVKCYQCDFKNWRKHPWVLIYLLYNMVIHRDATLIFSTSTCNIYGFMKILKKIQWKQNIIHWVIGGTLGDKVEKGIYDASVIGYADHTLVESSFMLKKLCKYNVKGVKQVPNFKPISYLPQINIKYPESGHELKLAFVSRIMPEKGCDYILDAANILNTNNLDSKFSIDFYGRISQDYESEFNKRIGSLSNVSYKGFLDFNKNDAYDKLAQYDMMLFPTYWEGEGFAGIFIDAFIAGLPILATDWAHNKAFLTDGIDSIFINPHDVNDIVDSIKRCIDGEYNLYDMALNAQKNAKRYDTKNVITEDLLAEIGL
jgi:glycosyltransferase involved in cell wall biosynthesis